jgi:hypothetical protein
VRLYAKGDRVSQPQYGTGTVMSTDEFHTVIDFDEHGSRTSATRLMRVESSNTAAPPAKPRRKAAAAPRKR